MYKQVEKMKDMDMYYDIQLNVLFLVMNDIKKVEDTEGLKISKVTMYIDAEWHSLNCVGDYDVTDIVRKHKSLALYNLAKARTINHSRVTVDIIIEWTEEA